MEVTDEANANAHLTIDDNGTMQLGKVFLTLNFYFGYYFTYALYNLYVLLQSYLSKRWEHKNISYACEF